MKIAAVYSDNPYAGWVQTYGFEEVLKGMGHEVTGIAVPARARRVTKAEALKINKPIDDCDLVIVSGPEWLSKWIQTFYPNWNSLKMPKVGWYHESFVREDFTLNFADYEKMYDFHFFPDKTDAEKYGHPWLPLGVDTKIFNPQPVIARDVAVAFIGQMYSKRAKFVEALKPFLGDIDIRMVTPTYTDTWMVPGICVYDFDGLNVRRSAELLAESYRRINVFVTFPAKSNVIVAKVLESLSCGCSLVAPKQPITLPGCFEYSTAEECAQQIRRAIKPSQYTDTPKRIHEQHRMELRFERIFQTAGIGKAACASS